MKTHTSDIFEEASLQIKVWEGGQNLEALDQREHTNTEQSR